MKVIISSKTLSSYLNRIDFNKEYMIEVGAEKDELILDTSEHTIRINCVINDADVIIKQETTRWDWLKKLVNQIDEQPIILDISDNVLNVIISY